MNSLNLDDTPPPGRKPWSDDSTTGASSRSSCTPGPTMAPSTSTRPYAFALLVHGWPSADPLDEALARRRVVPPPAAKTPPADTRVTPEQVSS